MTTMDAYKPLAQSFLDFVNASPSPYHVCESAIKLLAAKGYEPVSESQIWNLKPGGKYYFTRNQSSIVAFAIGGKYQPGNGFNIAAAHSDSPVLKIRPKSAVEAHGYLQVGCELYGGGLWHTWFDRDLTVAGRVIVKRGDKYKSELVKLNRPILRIPTLAIHLDRSVNTDGFKYNTQTHVLPIVSSAVKAQLGEPAKTDGDKPKHHPMLLGILAKALNANAEDIQNFDLNLCDTQPAVIGGALEEYLFSPRLDNQGMSFCSLQGLLESDASLKDEANVRVVVLFDNEEVGSNSAHGAAGPLLDDVIARITDPSRKSPEKVDLALRKSFLVSADMAHAVHPNHANIHEPSHQPAMNKGTVIKHNANLRYATTAPTAFIILELAKRNKIPVQEFVVKNDCACGSTIGPIVATRCGLRTVDIGNPQLSMHSIRETGGVADVTHGSNLIKAFFDQFTALDATLTVDE